MGSRFLALVLVAMMGGSLALASCSGARITPTTSETGTTTKSYGSLVYGSKDAGLAALDPQLSPNTQFFYTVGVAVFDTLLFADPAAGAELKPGLAERWEISPDGLTHTFYIRKGVKFHDGSDLTAADVKFSLDRQMAPTSTSKTAGPWRTGVANVDLKDDYTVVVRLKTPSFVLLPGLELAQSAVVPKKYVEAKGLDYFAKNPVGSGPWKWVSYKPGVSVELEAVESHWRPLPKFKSITILAIPELSTRIAMLKTGELDMSPVEPDSLPGLKAAGLHIFSYDSGSQPQMVVFYDMDHPEDYALGDVRVRKALSLAINRKEMIDKLLGGAGKMFVVLGVSDKAEFYDPNILKPDPYDPEGAKKLLAEAGYPNGFITKIWSVPGPLGTFGEAVEGYFRRVGVNAPISTIEEALLLAMVQPKHKPAIWNSVYVNLVGSGTVGFDRIAKNYRSGASQYQNTKSARLDELIDKFPQTRDPEERKRLALEASVLAKNEYSLIHLVNNYAHLAVGSKVGEVSPFGYSVFMGTVFETITHPK